MINTTGSLFVFARTQLYYQHHIAYELTANALQFLTRFILFRINVMHVHFQFCCYGSYFTHFIKFYMIITTFRLAKLIITRHPFSSRSNR